jgi:CheY-like chemotaxis protein
VRKSRLAILVTKGGQAATACSAMGASTYWAAAQGPRKTRPRSLVIDDRPDVRYIAGRRLGALGHEVLEAPDGATGLHLARAYRPEVVLVDIVLPDMDGYELARLLRAELGPTVRIAAMTGFPQFDASRSLDAGFDQHFLSPIEPAALESWLGVRPSGR